MKIAVTMPGKIGDALYALPTIRYLYQQTGAAIDFYTSTYCAPIVPLFEYQSCVERVIIPAEYRIERMDMGVQPWEMPIYGEYDAIHHLGFKSVPNTALHQYMAAQIGINEPLAIEYEAPLPQECGVLVPESPYICLATRGMTTFLGLFSDVSDRFQTCIIGASGEYMGHGLDYTGLSLLQTASLLAHSVGFVGLMSSQLVLANGFDIPRVAPHDGKSWDMSHVVNYHRNFYPIHPSADDVMRLLGL